VIDKEHGRAFGEGKQVDSAEKNAFYGAVYGRLVSAC